MTRIQKTFLLIVVLAILAISGIRFPTQADVADRRDHSPILKSETVKQLERRLTVIDEELNRLARYSLSSGVGSIGYRSRTYEDAHHSEWIQINFDHESDVDAIALIPCILRDAVTGFTSDGFPLEFRVVAGVGPQEKEVVVASYDANSFHLPRIAPLVIHCERFRAEWVRVEATVLSPRRFDGKYLLQLAEIMVLSNQENIALGQSLTYSSSEPSKSPAWDASFVVDGFLPYLMTGPTGTGSLAFVSAVGIDDQPTLTIDLESVQPISQINLHLVDQSDTVPQTYSGDFGVPRLLRIEGASRADFSDAKLLEEFHHQSAFDTGPIFMRRFPETACRYVRLTAIDPFVFSTQTFSGAWIGFAEIELLAKGQNVALGKPALSILKPNDPERPLTALTDGKNFYCQILPFRIWIVQLARRHELETLRPRVAVELNNRYLRQSTNLKLLIWLAGLLAVGALSAILIGWNLQQRAVTQTRERIAADLHDELGANFHAIGLLSDLAQANCHAPEKLNPLMKRMRELTERTGTAARNCANMLESKGLFDDLEQGMRMSAGRIMADLEHEFTFEGAWFLVRLNPRRRIDILLFHKECLINIIRHSGATRATTQVTADEKSVQLTISDNGHGLADSQVDQVPPSLLRRARLLGGKASVIQPKNGGTCIQLKVRFKKFGIFS